MINSEPKKSVLLLSGGMDSLTCLAMAQAKGETVYPLSFDYGQKHRSELLAAQKIATHFKVKHRMVDIPDVGRLSQSALTDPDIQVSDYRGDGEIPVTYVPARNIIFLSIALGYAESIGASKIIVGVSSVDYSGYPDCRPEFIQAFQSVINTGTKAGVENQAIQIDTPLIHLSKAETIQAGLDLGVDYRISVTCYRANDEGKACGDCDSCVLRREGFATLGVADQTLYA